MSSKNDFIQIYLKERIYLPVVFKTFSIKLSNFNFSMKRRFMFEISKVFSLKDRILCRRKSNIKSFIEAIKSLLLTLPPCLMFAINQISIAAFKILLLLFYPCNLFVLLMKSW